MATTQFRHGIRQLRTGWADGPAYITQCPLQTGQSYVYNFTITGQRGTLWWHAHILWLRATLYGAVVILPKLGVPYPFPTPHKELVLILGTWWLNWANGCLFFSYAWYLLCWNTPTNYLFLFLGFPGEWWKSDVEAVVHEAAKSGLAPNVSDAHTINGHPGPVNGCLTRGKGMFVVGI